MPRKLEDGNILVQRDRKRGLSIVRRSIVTEDLCTQCGRERTGSTLVNPTLYQYGVLDDSNGVIEWNPGLFCSVQCHDYFHELRTRSRFTTTPRTKKRRV